MTTAKHQGPKNHWLDSWHVDPSLNRNYDFIDGLRGIAILMVLACHHFYVNPEGGETSHFIGGVFKACGNGVILFFALSGFLISWPFWRRKFAASEEVIPKRYGWRRFWKIYPPLALSILVFVPILALASGDRSYWVIGAEWLAGVPFLLPVSGKVNPVMWTLVIEVQFYAVLPLLFLALKKVPAKICLWLIPLLFLVPSAGFRLLTGLSATFHPDINSHFPSMWDCFCFGVLMGGLENADLLRESWARIGIVGLFIWPLVLLMSGWTEMHPQSNGAAMDAAMDWMPKIAAGCLLCYVANPRHPIAMMLCAPWLRWCGIVSYEWYLFHQPIISWARNFFGPAGGSSFKYLSIVGGSLLFSTILIAVIYRYFSLPILKYGRSSRAKNEKPLVPAALPLT